MYQGFVQGSSGQDYQPLWKFWKQLNCPKTSCYPHPCQSVNRKGFMYSYSEHSMCKMSGSGGMTAFPEYCFYKPAYTWKITVAYACMLQVNAQRKVSKDRSMWITPGKECGITLRMAIRDNDSLICNSLTSSGQCTAFVTKA